MKVRLVSGILAVLWGVAIVGVSAAADVVKLSDVQSLKGSAVIGKKVAQKHGCVNCHGLDGRSTAPGRPHLAGLAPEYLMAALTAFSQGAVTNNFTGRKNEHMTAIAAGLAAQEIADVAVYYSSRSCFGADKSAIPAVPKPPLVNRCESCHGPDGNKPVTNNIPRLAGQDWQYLVNQVLAYKAHALGKTGDTMTNARGNWAMDRQVKKVTQEQASQIARYFSTRSCR